MRNILIGILLVSSALMFGKAQLSWAQADPTAAQDCVRSSEEKVGQLQNELGIANQSDQADPRNREIVSGIEQELADELRTLAACRNALQQLTTPTTQQGSAQNTQTPTSTTLYNPLGTTSIESFVGRVIRIVLSMAGIAAFLMFIWGGILWMTSAGNADRIQKGKDTLIWATIGLVVLFTAYAIVETLIRALSTGSLTG